MANRDILQRIRELHDDCVKSNLTIEEFGTSLRGCVDALEGLQYHEHIARADDFVFNMEHPEYASDGNIFNCRYDESELLTQFSEWLEAVTEFCEKERR